MKIKERSIKKLEKIRKRKEESVRWEDDKKSENIEIEGSKWKEGNKEGCI